MASINEQAKKDVKSSKVKGEHAIKTGETSGGREYVEKEDAQEEYLKVLESVKEKHKLEAEDNNEYDEDGNVVWTWKKVIDPLPSIDHSKIKYHKFVSNCYKEHPDIANLTAIEVFELRNTLDIRVFGLDPPKPCTSFAHFGFDQKIISRLQKSEFEAPTSIQSQVSF
jgi:ATP-dependent RNA helicase DDX42